MATLGQQAKQAIDSSPRDMSQHNKGRSDWPEARTYTGGDQAYKPSTPVHVASTVLVVNIVYCDRSRAHPGQGRVMTTHQQRWLLSPTTGTSSIMLLQ